MALICCTKGWCVTRSAVPAESREVRPVWYALRFVLCTQCIKCIMQRCLHVCGAAVNSLASVEQLQHGVSTDGPGYPFCRKTWSDSYIGTSATVQAYRPAHQQAPCRPDSSTKWRQHSMPVPGTQARGCAAWSAHSYSTGFPNISGD